MQVKTIQNQAWDEIAKEHLHSEQNIVHLIRANPKLASEYMLMPPDLTILLPPKPETKQEVLPPWKS